MTRNRAISQRSGRAPRRRATAAGFVGVACIVAAACVPESGPTEPPPPSPEPEPMATGPSDVALPPGPTATGEADSAPPLPTTGGVEEIPPGSGACSGQCSGKASTALVESITARASSTKSCFDELLRRDANAGGRLVVSLRVGADGTTCGVRLGNGSLKPDAPFRDCVQKAFSGKHIEPKGGCVDISVPLVFAAPKGDAGSSATAADAAATDDD